MATVFNALRSLLAQHESANRDDAQGSSRRLQVAACALLLELAHADADFSPAERQQIQDAAMRHFDMDGEAARDLMRVADAARREAVDLHQFTNLIVHHYDEGQRMVLAETCGA